MKKTNLNITFKSTTGFTLVEVMVAMLIFAILTTGFFAILSFSANTARRATNESEGNGNVVNELEKIASYPYINVTASKFSVQYITDVNGDLIYALTTTITEVSSPVYHKNIVIDYTWSDGKVDRHTRYYYVKTR